MKKELKTIQGNVLVIESESKEIISHFNNWRNYTDAIILQMNEKNMYKDILPQKK